MTAVGLVGGALTMSRAVDTEWQVREPVSNLGVYDGSAAIMTMTLLGLGVILLALGVSLDRTFARLRSGGRLTPRAEWLLRIGFVAAGVAMVLTALFPIRGGASTVIHNIAGFAIPVVLMSTLVGARLALGKLGRDFDRLSALVTIGVLLFFGATYWLHLMPYGLMELICFGLIGAWLWVFEARLRFLVAGL